LRNLSICTINKNQSKFTPIQQATENSKEGNAKQRTKDQEKETKKEQKNKIKHFACMNNSASLTHVQGPSTVACMIVTSLSQIPH
jgi:hypothetical protein